MALQPIEKHTGNGADREPLEAVKAKELPLGETITGYFVKVLHSDGKFGKTHNLLMQGEDGTRFVVFTVGTLKYDAKDEALAEGLMTQIKRLDDETRQNQSTGVNYTTSVFEVLQDPDNKIDVGSSNNDSRFQSQDEKKSQNMQQIRDDVNKTLGKGDKKSGKKK